MKHNLVIAAVLVAVIACIQLAGIGTKKQVRSYTDMHYALYKNKEAYTGIINPEPIEAVRGKVDGAIISHHFYVEREMSKLLLSLKNQDPETIVIIGPDHFGAASSDIAISKLPYSTPFGLLEPEEEIIHSIIENTGAVAQERVFETEHSISSLVGIIKHVFPRAKIVPILLSRGMGYGKLDELSKVLAETLPQKSLVLASVDFSHHQNRITAKFHDSRSIAAVQSFDLESLKMLEVDSPQSLYVLQRYLIARGSQKMSFWTKNQAEYSGNLASEDVTSYLFAYFSKGKAESFKTFSLLAFGDAMFDRGVESAMAKGVDPFENIKGVEGNFLRGVDYISVNLEGPISENTFQCGSKEISFRFDKKVATLIAENNVNIVNLANNHSSDCGVDGLNQTISSLKESKIHSTISDSSITLQVNGGTIAFVGFNLLSPSMLYLEQVYSIVENLNNSHDEVILNVHWGIEYNTQPSKEQVEIAHKLVDRGADAIIGHHPHVIQPLEVYKNKPIFYSIGNFIFDQSIPGTDMGLAPGFVFKEKVIEIFLFPFRINGIRPELLNYGLMESFCSKYLQGFSAKDTCNLEIDR